MDEDFYLERRLQTALETALKDTPVVCLLGPRQSGKTTLAKRLDPDRVYISLDDENYYQAAASDPQGFIAQLPEFVTLDEIQRIPELTRAIKRSVDADRRSGRFLLTGSANLLHLPRLADSLAGRMECQFLHPFAEAEKEKSPGRFLEQWLSDDLDKSISSDQPPVPSLLPERL